MNKLRYLYVLIFSIFVFSLTAQEINPMLTAFQKSFARGSLSTKIQVLQDSSKITERSMGPLYVQALQFIIDNNRTLHDDTTARELTVLTVRLSGLRHYKETARLLWKLFKETDDTGVQVEILSALGEIDTPVNIIEEMNDWLGKENEKVREGNTVPFELVSEMVTTLGKLGSPSSFNVLFSTGALKYNNEITGKAASALKKLGTDYAESLIDVIQNNKPEEKLAAVDLAVADKELTDAEKGKIFQAALETVLLNQSLIGKEGPNLRELRLTAVKQLTLLKWTAASALAVQNFNKTIEEIDSGLASTTQLVESINFLGSVNTHEAAVRLSVYLEVLNSRKERGQQVNTQIVMAVIRNLGLLGDKTAFDNLLYAGYLDYSSSVKNAVREALNNLKTN